MKAVLWAGGLGTRLRPLTNNKQKCMIDINGKPCLERIIDYLNSFGITNIIVKVHFKYEQVMDYFGSKVKSVPLKSHDSVVTSSFLSWLLTKNLNGDLVYSEINSAESSSEKEKYRNLRAEMWAKAADKFELEKVSLEKDSQLIEDLTQMKYKTIESNGKLQVESKDDFKKRMGRSPGRGDAFVMGLWAVERAGIIDAIEERQIEDSMQMQGHTFFRRH